jgi:hypothetical protein
MVTILSITIICLTVIYLAKFTQPTIFINHNHNTTVKQIYDQPVATATADTQELQKILNETQVPSLDDMVDALNSVIYELEEKHEKS